MSGHRPFSDLTKDWSPERLARSDAHRATLTAEMAEETRPCPSCGGVMRRSVQEETVTYQGESLTYPQPGWHCENGDDGVLEGSDNHHADAALHSVMARTKGERNGR